MKIVLSTVLALFLIGCGQESKEESSKDSTQSAKTEAVKPVETTVAEEIKEKTSSMGETLVETKEKVEVAVEKAVENTKVATVEKVAEVKEVTKEVVQNVEAKVAEVKQEITQAVSSDGETIYKSCASCHGANAEKPALGKSQVIQGWSSEKTINALNGYKDGSYGGAMKGIMKGQVTKLSADDIKAVSEHISKL